MVEYDPPFGTDVGFRVTKFNVLMFNYHEYFSFYLRILKFV